MPEPTTQVQVAPPEPTPALPPEVAKMNFNLDNAHEMLQRGGDTVIKIDGQEVKEEKPVITGTQEIGGERKEEKPVETKLPTEVKEKPVEKIESKPVVEPILKAPKEEKKVEVVAKEEKKVETPQPQDLSKLIKPPDGGEADDKFDYTPYDAQTQVNLRNMSRQSREWVSGIMKENNGLRDNKQGTFFEHEQGYILTPEFSELRQKDYFNRTEAQAWQDALINIRQGKPFKDIVGFDQKTQTPIYSAERTASDTDQVRVEQNLSRCLTAVDANKAQAQNMAGQHGSRVKADLATIDSVRKERFSWAQDPKVLEYTMKGSNGQETKLKDIITNFKSVWPSYMSNHPAVQVAADLMVALEIRTAELREALAKATVSDIKAQEVKRGEPSSDHQPNGDGKAFHEINGQKVPKTFSLDMMPS